MFGLGVWEIVVILLIALLVLGPQKLPELARQLARLMGEAKRVSDEMRRTFEEATREPPIIQLPPVDNIARQDDAPKVILAASDAPAEPPKTDKPSGQDP